MALWKRVQELSPKVTRRFRQVLREAVTHRSFTFPPEMSRLSMLAQALDDIEARWPTAPDTTVVEPRPVFVLSAGWRSGSTLLQRLICSSGEIVVWGEPLGDAAIIPRLADSLTAISSSWPPDHCLAPELELTSFSDNWIANIAPPISSLRLAHRAFFDQWLGKPARERYGSERWGLKEVRLTIEHARYLKWLYPGARFVFIYRDLADAYRSWRGNGWASVWPGYFSWSPVAYARHWKLLLSGYLEGWRDVDGYLVRYEDLVAGKVDLPALAAHIGIRQINGDVLEKRIASPATGRKRRKKWVTPVERAILNTVAGDLARRAAAQQSS
jgi:hypothetical protein